MSLGRRGDALFLGQSSIARRRKRAAYKTLLAVVEVTVQNGAAIVRGGRIPDQPAKGYLLDPAIPPAASSRAARTKTVPATAPRST